PRTARYRSYPEPALEKRTWRLTESLSFGSGPDDNAGHKYRGGRFMTTAKAEVASMLTTLPEDASLEDIQYHLYVLEKVKRGMDRADHQGAIPHEDVKKRLGKWLDSWLGHRRPPRTSNTSRSTSNGIRLTMREPWSHESLRLRR